MEFENQGIKCSKFWDAEAVIEKIEDKIRKARSSKERQYYSQDVLLEAETLLSCLNYNTGNPDCLSCHSISHKRLKEYEYLAKDEINKSKKKPIELNKTEA